MRIQRAIKNREKIYSGTLQQIKDKIQALADRHDCSKSFVINTILADAVNVKLEDRYDDYRKDAGKSHKRA